jgi:Skp family chaperone for outer membrane proteins
MTRQRSGECILGIALTGILAASATGQTAAPKARPLLVGVVDLGLILTNYERSAEVTREIEREKEMIESKGKEQQRSIEGLVKELDATPEGTTAWRVKAAELKLARKALEAMRVEADAIVNQRFEALTLQVIDEIDEAVHGYAKANGFDLILKTTTKGWGESRLPERIYRAQVSTLVAYDPKLDVTAAILSQLNDAESLKKKSFH